MIRQPEYGSRNVNDMFYKEESRQIEKMNKVLGDIKLSKEEERSLIWLAGCEDSTVDNFLSVIKKAVKERAEKTVKRSHMESITKGKYEQSR